VQAHLLRYSILTDHHRTRDQLLCYVGGNLLQRHYTIPFPVEISTYVIEVKIPQLTTPDPRSIAFRPLIYF